MSVRENLIKRGDDFFAARVSGNFRIAHAECSGHKRNARCLYFFYCVRDEKHFAGPTRKGFSDFRIAVTLRFCSDARVEKMGNVFRQITRDRAAKDQLLRQHAP